MKILRIIHSVNPHGGGPVEGLKKTALAHQEMGHEVEALSLDAPDAPFISDFPFTLSAVGTGADGYGFCRGLTQWLEANADRFDAVIVHGLWQYHGFGAWRVLRKKSVPYFVFPHGMLDPWFKINYPLKHLKKWLYWPWGEYRVLRDARAVLFTCEEEKRLARASFWLYRCRERVVHYGTAMPSADHEEQQKKFYAKFPDLKGKRLLLYLSRIHEKKGVDLLIKAFSESNFGDAMRLMIAGPCADAPYLEMLKQLAAKRKSSETETETGTGVGSISWPGMLEGDLKWGAFHAAEAFILPSHQENFGISVAEALATGTPVLITNKVNIWREISEAKAGYVEDDTGAGISQLLKRWLNTEPEAAVQMASCAKRCFMDNFEITHAAENLIEVIREEAL